MKVFMVCPGTECFSIGGYSRLQYLYFIRSKKVVKGYKQRHLKDWVTDLTATYEKGRKKQTTKNLKRDLQLLIE